MKPKMMVIKVRCEFLIEMPEDDNEDYEAQMELANNPEAHVITERMSKGSYTDDDIDIKYKE